MSFISPANLPSYHTDLLLFDRIFLSAESWMKEVIKSKFSCSLCYQVADSRCYSFWGNFPLPGIDSLSKSLWPPPSLFWSRIWTLCSLLLLLAHLSFSSGLVFGHKDQGSQGSAHKRHHKLLGVLVTWHDTVRPQIFGVMAGQFCINMCFRGMPVYLKWT